MVLCDFVFIYFFHLCIGQFFFFCFPHLVSLQTSLRVSPALSFSHFNSPPFPSSLSLSFYSLMSSRRYYFEVLHKQDDRGSDHVEVAVSKEPEFGKFW